LKVKVNVRDLWDSPESEVKKEFASLKSVLGLDVSAEPQWQLLWTELKAHFKEPEQFVPNIASATAAWARALKNICDMDENEDWVEELLERVKSAGSMLRLELEVRLNFHHVVSRYDGIKDIVNDNLGYQRDNAVNFLV
jgi:hypothetical protein